MRIIKHKTRRRTVRGIEPDTGYYVIEGSHSVGTIEEAAEIAIDVWCQEISTAQRAPTIWEQYGYKFA